jgi:hypothetical protein
LFPATLAEMTSYLTRMASTFSPSWRSRETWTEVTRTRGYAVLGIAPFIPSARLCRNVQQSQRVATLLVLACSRTEHPRMLPSDRATT